MAFCIKILQAGSWAWMTGIVLTSFIHCSLLVSKYLGLGQDGNTNSGIIGFDPKFCF
jgi:hypothetical protein